IHSTKFTGGVRRRTAELEIFKAQAVRVQSGIEVHAQCVRRNVVGVTELLRGTCGAIRSEIVVLEEIETIERPCTAPHIPIDTFIRAEITVGLNESCIQGIKGRTKGFRCRQILFRALGIREPEDLVLDDRSSCASPKLLSREGRWRSRSGTRQRRCSLIATEHAK